MAQTWGAARTRPQDSPAWGGQCCHPGCPGEDTEAGPPLAPCPGPWARLSPLLQGRVCAHRPWHLGTPRLALSLRGLLSLSPLALTFAPSPVWGPGQPWPACPAGGSGRPCGRAPPAVADGKAAISVAKPDGQSAGAVRAPGQGRARRTVHGGGDPPTPGCPAPPPARGLSLQALHGRGAPRPGWGLTGWPLPGSLSLGLQVLQGDRGRVEPGMAGTGSRWGREPLGLAFLSTEVPRSLRFGVTEQWAWAPPPLAASWVWAAGQWQLLSVLEGS